MLLKRFSASFSRLERGIRLAADEALADSYVLQFFERSQVAGEVAIGEPKDFLQSTEVGPDIDHQDGHDAQPDAVFKGFVQFVEKRFHLVGRQMAWTGLSVSRGS